MLARSLTKTTRHGEAQCHIPIGPVICHCVNKRIEDLERKVHRVAVERCLLLPIFLIRHECMKAHVVFVPRGKIRGSQGLKLSYHTNQRNTKKRRTKTRDVMAVIYQ